MKRKIKILIIDPLQSRGGQEKHVLTLLNHLDRQLFHIQFCCSLDPAFDLPGILPDVIIHRVGMASKFSIRSILRLYKLFRLEKFDIINPHGTRAGLLAGVAALLAHKSTVWTTHVSLSDFAGRYRLVKQWLYSKVGEYLNLKTSMILTVAEDLKRQIVENDGIPPNKIRVVYNCVDIDSFSKERPNEVRLFKQELGFNNESLLFGTVGLLKEQKGIIYLLRAFKELITKVGSEHAKLLVVGEGPQRMELENFVRSSELESDVLFVGYRTDIPKCLAAMDIFILPSLYEGLPLSLLEAMASGKAVIATRVNGVTEIINNNYNGILVEPQNPDALYKKMLYLSNNRSQVEFLGKNARTTVNEMFSVDAFVQRVENALLDALIG